jgi:SH3 domain protein
MTQKLSSAPRPWLWLALLVTLGSVDIHAQDSGYIADKILVPLRSGAGNEYRILNRGLPTGTRLNILSRSEDGIWVEVETPGGAQGWVPAQHVQAQLPAATRVENLEEEMATLRRQLSEAQSRLTDSQSEANAAGGEIGALQAQLRSTQQQLAEVQRISAAAIDLDAMNKELTVTLESERNNAELLRLENIRLQERIESNQMLDGALAVLLGVIIAFVAPRMIPRRRRNDGWS